ncbi:hypothetical protein DTL42_03485 [Bremerella cremea]|uniref:DUF4175 domain-containing protein n=1 Tax=Bremerella cremea TaxID=1031537 RepID=A0A368KYA1_9BACT|nr:DUF4175 family protein [Bremerella cremea]RCS54222.1 hypothetical protein DTL42_03485 [Bremerella cremea]
MSTTQLHSLKLQIKRLRDARDSLRLATAITGAFFWLAGVLLTWFVLDYGLNLSSLHRLLTMLISLPVLAYGLSRAFLALRGWGASLIETAITVEHRHGLDGDLVAAIQFEQGQAIGSPELQQAVVDYVSQLKHEINVFDGFDFTPVRNRLVGVGLILFLFAGAAFVAPRYVGTFFQRLAMSNASYPTQTTIASIELNGNPISLEAASQASTLGFGSPLELRIACQGVLPQSCRLVITGPQGGTTQAVLQPEVTQPHEFHYSVPRLIEPIRYQVFAGDAKTPELSVEIIPLPTIKVELAATPPDYAQNIQLSSSSSSTHLAVLAGSDVTLNIIADRPIDAPTLTLRRGSSEMQEELVPVGSSTTNWQLPPAFDPLNQIQETIAYELTAVDEHGLSPATPVRGTIRVVPDRVPSVSLRTIHHIVLPSASPVLHYRATDDFGLATLSLRLEIRRGDSAPRIVEVPLRTFAAKSPVQKNLAGEYALDLAPWQLQVGDQVEIVLQASDFRDNAARQRGQSEPLHLEIGDESNVLAAIAEADKQSEQMLNQLIEQQLGLGESR